MELFEIFRGFIFLASGISVTLSLFSWKKFNEIEKVFGVYILLCSFFEVIAWATVEDWSKQFMSDLGFENNLPGFHLFTLLQFAVLWIFFCKVFKKDGLSVPCITILLSGSLAILINVVFIEGIFVYSALNKTLTEMGIMFCSMVYFYRLVLSDQLGSEDESISFFVIAVFINAALSILIHLFNTQIIEMDETHISHLFDFRALVNLLTQIIIIYGIFVIMKRKNEGREIIAKVKL